METKASGLLIVLLVLAVTLSCENSESGGDPQGSSGKGGSMACFTISDNHLYSVDRWKLNVFDISDPGNPVFVKSMGIGQGVETIFALNHTLFLGSQSGMFIFDISDPTNPVSLSFFQHIYSCDPVVANDTIAYLTMRTETFCGRNTNELQVIDIKNKRSPNFISSVPMTKPFGLGLDRDKLFVCDNGLKVFSLENPFHPVLMKTFSIPAMDVIPDNDLLLVLALDGLHQYKYANDTITFLSHLQ